MTRLEAFRQAQQTGQIAISEKTAKAFAECMQMDEAFWNIMELFQSNYAEAKVQDEIVQPYSEIYSTLYNEILKGIMDECISENGLSMLEFKGL